MTKDIQKWADPAMFSSEKMAESSPRVYLLSMTPDPLGSMAAMAKMYKGEVVRNLETVTDDERRHFWEEVKKTHLKAPLEAIDLHFMVEGVTRAFTHQMVRQRTAVYAQESLRFAVKEGFAGEVPYPPSIDPKEEGASDIWEKAIEASEEAYEALVNMGVPAEDARGLLPHAITTRLNYKTNLRNLLDHAGNRLCTQAQFEWRQVFIELVRSIYEHRGPRTGNIGGFHSEYANAWQFKLIATDNVFKPICYELGHCPFTADFDRGCTIRGRVEEGKFDEINASEWMADPAAARRG